MSEPCVCGSVEVLHFGARSYCARCFGEGRTFAEERVRQAIKKLLKERENADGYRYKRHEHTFSHCEYMHFAEELQQELGLDEVKK